jgi:hypothetical protein
MSKNEYSDGYTQEALHTTYMLMETLPLSDAIIRSTTCIPKPRRVGSATISPPDSAQ